MEVRRYVVLQFMAVLLHVLTLFLHLYIKGLLAAEVNQRNCSETMKFLLSRQKPDGSFMNLGATIYVLPSLVGALPYDVREIACHKSTTGIIEDMTNTTRTNHNGWEGSYVLRNVSWTKKSDLNRELYMGARRLHVFPEDFRRFSECCPKAMRRFPTIFRTFTKISFHNSLWFILNKYNIWL